MGRIRTQLVKSASSKIFKAHRKEFKKDFNENKKLVSQFAKIESKKMRNWVAGYITRLMNQQERV